MENKMYQVSTLQALALGYSRAVITVEELIKLFSQTGSSGGNQICRVKHG